MPYGVNCSESHMHITKATRDECHRCVCCQVCLRHARMRSARPPRGAPAVPQRFLVQAVVANHSELQGRTIRDSRFRTRFHAAVLAVHRRGHRLHLKVGDIEVHVSRCG